MRKGRIFFLDMLVVFVISIILVLSAVVLVRNWSLFVVENTVGRLTDSLALDISENLINSPGCVDFNCSEVWKGGNTLAIPGLAAIGDNEGIRNYILDGEKVQKLSELRHREELFMGFVPEELGRNVSYSIAVREIGGKETVLLESEMEPEVRVSVVRRLVMIKKGEDLVNGLLEVKVIV